jgi:predicted  nucleic acid-binding Zn-ribbon protein
VAIERLQKYEDLVEFLDGEISHFKQETEKLMPEVDSVMKITKELAKEQEELQRDIRVIELQIREYQVCLP